MTGSGVTFLPLENQRDTFQCWFRVFCSLCRDCSIGCFECPGVSCNISLKVVRAMDSVQYFTTASSRQRRTSIQIQLLFCCLEVSFRNKVTKRARNNPCLSPITFHPVICGRYGTQITITSNHEPILEYDRLSVGIFGQVEEH